MTEELRRRALEEERDENEKTAFQRNRDKLADSAGLPTRSKYLLKVYVLLIIVMAYPVYTKTFARPKHQRQRRDFYDELNEKRAGLEEVYIANKSALAVTVMAAAVVYLVAAERSTLDDPVQQPLPEMFYRSVWPPAKHFHLHSGF